MTFRRSIRRLTLPAFALIACAVGTAWAGPASAPFKASATTQEWLIPDPGHVLCPGVPGNPDWNLFGTTTGRGNASQLGTITVVAIDCPLPQDASGANWRFDRGSLTMTAANGDALTAGYSGTLVLNPSTGLHSLSGEYTVTGGTGRFAGATGKGELKGTLNLSSGLPAPGQLEVNGVLSYPARP